MSFQLKQTDDLFEFGYPDSSANFISVVGIGAFGEGAVNYMEKCGLTGVDYYLFHSNQTSVEIAQTMDNMKRRMFYHRLVFLIGGADELSESQLYQRVGNFTMQFSSVIFGLLTIPLSFGKNKN